MHIKLEDKFLYTKNEYLDYITGFLGGRVAEELIFNEITSGASNDLTHATELAQSMVCEFGMSERLGNLTFGKKDTQVFLGRDLMKERDYSENTAQIIDQEVKRIVDECYRKAQELLGKHRDKLEKLRVRLLEEEVLDGGTVQEIVGIYKKSREEPKAKKNPKISKGKEKT